MTLLRPQNELERRVKQLEAENAELRDVHCILRPNRPLIIWLLAAPGGHQFRWFFRVLGHGRWWSEGAGGGLWDSYALGEIDERHSDDIAVAMWKLEVEKEVAKIKSNETIDVPNGAYEGKWSGYQAEFEHDGRTHRVQTDIGVRGLNCPCIVTVKDGAALVKAK